MHEFTHGIDHFGRNGIFPILVVGHKICEEDFELRDLSDIRGVIIRQRGLDGGCLWGELNVSLLANRLPNLELIDISFEDSCDVEELGVQPHVKYLSLNCPKLRKKDLRQFSSAEFVDISVPEKHLSELISNSVRKLVISRPKFKTLEPLGLRPELESLRIQYARNLETLEGVGNFEKLVELFITDAPNLVSVGGDFSRSSVENVLLSGVRALVDISGLGQAKVLKSVEIFSPSKKIVIPENISGRINLN